MIVLSLFDGISCGQLALQRAGIKIDKYFSSEIKKCAIDVAMYNYPNTIQIGDVKKVHFKDGILSTETGDYNIGKIDLLIGGSPCQNFSSAAVFSAEKDGSTYGLLGEKSKLFYEYLRIKREVNPTFFLLENVKMKPDSENQLNQFMGVVGIHINSNLVSFQNRAMIYWTNIPNVTVPQDRGINFQDYKDTDYDYCKQFKVNRTVSREKMWNNGDGCSGSLSSSCPNITYKEKINCLTRKQDRSPNSGLIEFEDFCRYLTRNEIELAQTLPLGYTKTISYLQMQDVCGDGWTVDVIAHIFSFLHDAAIIQDSARNKRRRGKRNINTISVVEYSGRKRSIHRLARMKGCKV